MTHLLRQAGTAAVIVVLGTGCASDPTGGADGLGSAAAAVACSDHVFWGTVEATTVEADGLKVTFRVDDWVRPASGDSVITLVADDPAVDVGAPDWSTSERVLVIDDPGSPLDFLQGDAADDMVAGWELDDAPVSCTGEH